MDTEHEYDVEVERLKGEVTELHGLLDALMDASRPYLRRKKETPRAECKHLNEVHTSIREYLKK